ncbi:EscU/YscU/HrcU family type III secretion system export apparatus switch protein [Camelliibacillus cellulosilyticus]|uniref:EscU/YscU/HrcU family type III secretion system export apparatus switch protein n=1 Tax=Camelliibacillus cellulosilyticus TaxID=2174486 RepID=A0ABV9GJP3_9BACL
MNQSKQPKKAVALHYQPNDDVAPRLIAKGTFETAEKIIQVARENNIPIQEDKTLVGLLLQLDIGMAIPPELYEAVAEIFAFVYRLDQEASQS